MQEKENHNTINMWDKMSQMDRYVRCMYSQKLLTAKPIGVSKN